MLFKLTAGIRTHIKVRVAEWALGTILFNFGWILLLPAQTFDGPSYAGMARVAPEGVWGLACLIVGAARLVALFINGTRRRTPHVRAIMAFLSCFFWLQISLCFLQAGTVPTGLAVYPVLLALDIFNLFRASSDARLSDEVARNGRA
ncbi:hypothetical protein [Faunimonas pinastri]|nr:hypothetical protein [Faunimonas pinastri]